MSTEENGMTQDQGTDGVRQTQGTEDRVSDATPDEARTAVSTLDGDRVPEGHASDGGNRGPEGHDSEPEVFPAKVVRDLRKENARYRERAQKADDLAHRLHTALVAGTGKLADPTDLEFDEAHLEDPDALAAAVDDLLARKPHLRARRVAGDVGQGNRGKTGNGPDLLEAMRGTL